VAISSQKREEKIEREGSKKRKKKIGMTIPQHHNQHFFLSFVPTERTKPIFCYPTQNTSQNTYTLYLQTSSPRNTHPDILTS
jgi:hypothetical protein